MNLFAYLKHTQLAQIRADWSEYMELCRNCTTLRRIADVAYDKIVTTANGEITKFSKPSCVCHLYYNNVALPATNNNDNRTWMRVEKCKKFYDGKKCLKSDCACVVRNHEYADACQHYDLMRKARRDFWNVKVAQASQNTK